jgi:HSP20 family protein
MKVECGVTIIFMNQEIKMTYIKFEPFRQMENWSDTMNRFFGENPCAVKYDTGYNPRVNVYEDETAYYAEIEIPGVKKEDIKITLHNNVLTVAGEKKPSAAEKDKKYYRNERHYGSFSRSFSFAEKVNPDSTEAKFEDGVLTVKVEKFRKESTEHVIEIK